MHFSTEKEIHQEEVCPNNYLYTIQIVFEFSLWISMCRLLKGEDGEEGWGTYSIRVGHQFAKIQILCLIS